MIESAVEEKSVDEKANLPLTSNSMLTCSKHVALYKFFFNRKMHKNFYVIT
jgi:hypothetical protein